MPQCLFDQKTESVSKHRHSFFIKKYLTRAVTVKAKFSMADKMAASKVTFNGGGSCFSRVHLTIRDNTGRSLQRVVIGKQEGRETLLPICYFSLAKMTCYSSTPAVLVAVVKSNLQYFGVTWSLGAAARETSSQVS